MNTLMPNEPERSEFAARLPFHQQLIAAQLTALLPEEAQDAGIHFAYVDDPAPAPKLIVPRPVYATALISEARRRAQELHAEMVANGTAEYAIPVPRHGEHRTLTARKIGVLVHPCPTRQHAEHPSWTCEEVEDAIESTDRFFEQAFAHMTTRTDMADLPEALRGPAWTPAPTTAPTVRR